MSKLTHSTDEGMDAIDRRRAIESGNEDLLPAMTAVSDETGRGVLESQQHIVEGIILRRLHDKRIEGYTLEMSKEIEAALSAAPVEPQPCNGCGDSGYPCPYCSPSAPVAQEPAALSAVAETRRAGSAGLSPPDVFSDPAPSSVEER